MMYQDIITNAVVECECGCGGTQRFDDLVACDLCGRRVINDKDHLPPLYGSLWSVCRSCYDNGAYEKALVRRIWELEGEVRR